MSRPIPILLDCDPGHDDAVAILLALGSPTIDLLGITTTFGNCAVEDATHNALSVLALAGSRVPVAQGAHGPLVSRRELANYVHGTSGLDGAELPEPLTEPVGEDAVSFLAQTLAAAEEPVVVVATGPVTNVAALVRRRSDVRDKIREIVFMGGSTEGGNHTPTAEFNAYADPEALDVVLSSGLPVRMVGLNLTHQALATPAVVERMSQLDHRLGRTCAAWMGFFGGSYKRIWAFDSPPVHDPCTIAALVDPDVIGWQEAFVAVELEGRWTRGTTVVDLHGRYPEHHANASVALTLDAPRYWDLVLSAVDALGSRS